MESAALTGWRQDGSRRVRRLIVACRSIERTGVLPALRSDRLRGAATILLAIEFVAFARDLHDRSVERFAALAAPTNPKLATVLSDLALRDRKLDQVTSQPADLGHDFGTFGLYLWSRLGERYAERWVDWHDALLAVDDARARTIGAPTAVALPPPNATELLRWLTLLDEIAEALDRVVTDHLSGLFGVDDPWRDPLPIG